MDPQNTNLEIKVNIILEQWCTWMWEKGLPSHPARILWATHVWLNTSELIQMNAAMRSR